MSQLVEPPKNNSNGSVAIPRSEWPVKVTSAKGANVLGILTFSVVFGIAISRLKEQTRVLQEFFIGLKMTIEKMVFWVIW